MALDVESPLRYCGDPACDHYHFWYQAEEMWACHGTSFYRDASRFESARMVS